MQISPLADGISEIQPINYMGTDLSVVNAARVSMAKHTKEFREQDRKLLNYLMKHEHWTPFSQPQIQLRITMPIFVARQWFKHQIGFTRNEVSRRYVSDNIQFFLPTELRKQAANVKQGSSNEILPANDPFYKDMDHVCQTVTTLYETMIVAGVCAEQARMILPQNMYTQFIETGSLAAYFRVMELRLDPHAQLEIRKYAEGIELIIKETFPECYTAWEANNE
jgi:thymidylate synthase (FAD)